MYYNNFLFQFLIDKEKCCHKLNKYFKGNDYLSAEYKVRTVVDYLNIVLSENNQDINLILLYDKDVNKFL